MKFRTEINIPPLTQKLSYADKLFFIGSCFSVNVFQKLKSLKFTATSNPFGIVYNPISVAKQLERVLDNTPYLEEELQFHNERWFSYDHHSDYSFSSKDECLTRINETLHQANNELKSVTFLFITLGSSWTYKLTKTGETVSNCHKIPANQFTKVLAETNAMVTALSNSINRIKRINPNIKVVISISPVIDDLRDYRFYNTDLVHPSNEAIQYVWEKFSRSVISAHALQTIEKVESIIRASTHRPFNPKSEAHQKFIRKTLQEITSLEVEIGSDFSIEKKELNRYLNS